MHFSTSAAALSLAALLPVPATAFFRIPLTSRLLDQRMDPLVFPGVVSGHVHQIAGSNGFGYTESYDNARNGSCTTSPITADFSNYWTPTLYYNAQNGSFIKVPQSGDGPSQLGGFFAYYLQRPGPNQDTLLAFPEGFRMIAGNPFKRTYTGDFAADAVSFHCLQSEGADPPETNALPNITCPDGLRAQVFFPSCWDGVNLDSADHSSHVAYPAEGAYNNGACPVSHPFHLISLFYEVYFSTTGFDWWEGNYGTGQPFVFAMGDPTGYGFHGDFINGWDVPTLQKAVDNCNDDVSGSIDVCEYFDFFTDAENIACILPSTIDEDIDGPFDTLPGCNPVTTDAAAALAAATADCPVTPIGAPDLLFTDATDLGWAYLGCIPDDSTTVRTLAAYSNINTADQASLTVQDCLNTCESMGYLYGAVEYGNQCFCDNSIAESRTPVAFGWCRTPCAGNSSQICGGGDLMSIYKSCNGSSSCTNVKYDARGDLTGGTTTIDQSMIFTELAAAISTAVAEMTSVYTSLASAEYSGVTPVSSDYSATSVASAITNSASLSSFLASVSSEASSVEGSAAATDVASSAATTTSASTSTTISSAVSTTSPSTTAQTSSVADKVVVATSDGSSSSSSSDSSSSSVSVSLSVVQHAHKTSRSSSSSSSTKTGVEYVTVTDFVTVTETISASAIGSKRAAKNQKHAHQHAHKRHDF